MMRAILTNANTGMGVTFGGLAKAAFDEALKYARERIQGGVPIIEHQNIKLKLMQMFRKVETSRSLARRTMAYNAAHAPLGSPIHAIASKVTSTEAATEVAGEAIQIFGGNGFNTAMPVEKLYRDCKIFQIYEGTSQIQNLIISRAIFEEGKK